MGFTVIGNEKHHAKWVEYEFLNVSNKASDSNVHLNMEANT